MKLASNMKVLGGALAVTLLFGCASDSGKEETNESVDVEKVENQDVSIPKESQSISDLSKETEIQQQDCEDKFKNEQGICEVPNPEYPKELIEKKTKDEDQDQGS